MARIKSAVKNIRKNLRRNEINRARRSRLRTQIRKLRELVSKKDSEGARKALTPTLSLIDRSLTKGILHRNTAARYKSRLTRQVSALGRAR
ncbi:MAG TPA: 30S ribosomal protein S20 [Candidatus Polarisedimenticolia bacterium]|nr:30S ribosomal protein S20 [Candidatus Polarisedimenticolia bacterium]